MSFNPGSEHRPGILRNPGGNPVQRRGEPLLQISHSFAQSRGLRILQPGRGGGQDNIIFDQQYAPQPARGIDTNVITGRGWDFNGGGGYRRVSPPPPTPRFNFQGNQHLGNGYLIRPQQNRFAGSLAQGIRIRQPQQAAQRLLNQSAGLSPGTNFRVEQAQLGPRSPLTQTSPFNATVVDSDGDDELPPRLIPQAQSPPMNHSESSYANSTLGSRNARIPEALLNRSQQSSSSAARTEAPRKLMKLKCKYHPLLQLFKDPTGNRFSDKDADVEFVCEDGSIKAHKVLLCTSSMFFVDLFNGQDPAEFTIVNVPEFTVKYVRTVVSLAYLTHMDIGVRRSEKAELEAVMKSFGISPSLVTFQKADENMETDSQEFDETVSRQPLGNLFGGNLSRPRKLPHLHRSLQRPHSQPLSCSLPANTMDDDIEFVNDVEESLNNQLNQRDLNDWAERTGTQLASSVEIDEDENEVDFRCSVCKTRFIDHDKFINHTKRHIRAGSYQCVYPDCGFLSTTLQLCFKHEREHQPQRPYKRRRSSTVLSNQDFGTPSDGSPPAKRPGLSVNDRSIESPSSSRPSHHDLIYFCKGCNRTYGTQEEVRAHCSSCAETQSIPLGQEPFVKHRRGFVGDKECHLCGNKYLKNVGYTIHCGHKHMEFRRLFNYNPRTESLECNQCFASFDLPIELAEHLNTDAICGRNIGIGRGFITSIPAGTEMQGTVPAPKQVRKHRRRRKSASSRELNASSTYDPTMEVDHTTRPQDSPKSYSTLSRSTRLADREKKKKDDTVEDEKMRCPLCKTVEENIIQHLEMNHFDLNADVSKVNDNYLLCLKCNSKLDIDDLLIHLNNCRASRYRGRTNSEPQASSSGGIESGEVWNNEMNASDMCRLALRCGVCGKVEKRIKDITACLRQHGKHRCCVCFNYYSSRDTLLEHQRIHQNDVSRLVCPLCSKSFGSTIQIVGHMHNVHWKQELKRVLDPVDWTPSLHRATFRTELDQDEDEGQPEVATNFDPEVFEGKYKKIQDQRTS